MATRLLDHVGLHIDPRDRVEDLSVAQRHLVEIAKALAVSPKLLILDEPTAPLGGDAVELFFRLVRAAKSLPGTSVVYITHRMAEVRELADRVTVLRDGRVRGLGAGRARSPTTNCFSLILGRQLDSTFPPKHVATDQRRGHAAAGGPGRAWLRRGLCLRPRGRDRRARPVWSGTGRATCYAPWPDWSRSTGTVPVGGSALSSRELLHRAAYMPADRHSEGLEMSLSVRENAALSALRPFTRGSLRQPRLGGGRRRPSLASLSVRAPSTGGARLRPLRRQPAEGRHLPGAALRPVAAACRRAHAGRRRRRPGRDLCILREASARGVPVVVASSDAKELEGLCDEVLVMSRGHVVATLRGDEVTEERIVCAAVSSRTEASGSTRAARRRRAAPVAPLPPRRLRPVGSWSRDHRAAGRLTAHPQRRYLSAFNVSTCCTAATALGFIALGQNIALLTGGIDLSVGPLAGFLVVMASFFVNDGKSLATVVLGLAADDRGRGARRAGERLSDPLRASSPRSRRRWRCTSPSAACASCCGPTQGGFITQGFQDAVNYSVGPLPLAFVVLVVLTAVMEFVRCAAGAGAGGCGRSGSDEESRRGASASTSTGRSSPATSPPALFVSSAR